MSVDCEAYIGYTVNIMTDLTGDNFELLEEFLEKNPEYNLYDCKGKVLLVSDGMSGRYARLIFVDEHIEDCWTGDKNYFKLRQTEGIPEDVYFALNAAYKKLFNNILDVNDVEYAAWFHFT